MRMICRMVRDCWATRVHCGWVARGGAKDGASTGRDGCQQLGRICAVDNGQCCCRRHLPVPTNNTRVLWDPAAMRQESGAGGLKHRHLQAAPLKWPTRLQMDAVSLQAELRGPSGTCA
jgi:hypothetical protein